MSRQKRSRQKYQLIAAGLIGTGALLLAGGAGPAVTRNGDAAHIQAIKDLETKPFPVELFDGLDSWSLGSPIDAQQIQGKVVLVALVSSDNPQSIMTLSSLARYQRLNADKGLVVLAIHPETGFDTISEQVASGRVKVQVARDIGGAFAKGMLSDGFPEVYVIDRAGQLRFGDVSNKSLKLAVTRLLNETPEEAIANAKLQAQGIEIALEEEVKVVKSIPPAMYSKANWPEQNKDKLTALDYQGKELPVALGNEEWLSEKIDTNGKVLVLDFWATWCGPCRKASPTLEKMQLKYKDKLAVLAIGGPSDKEATHRKYVIQHKKAYSNLYDKNGTIDRALQVRAIPHTIIISTDGVIRWQGNPLNPSFTKVLEQVIKADPMFAED